jgi:hypothetical protein
MMMYVVEMTSGGMIYVTNFVKIHIGLQAIPRFGLRNLRGSNVGITGVKDL